MLLPTIFTEIYNPVYGSVTRASSACPAFTGKVGSTEGRTLVASPADACSGPGFPGNAGGAERSTAVEQTSSAGSWGCPSHRLLKQ